MPRVAHGDYKNKIDEEVHSSLTKKERDFYRQELWPRNLQRLSIEDSTSCLRILKLKDTLEVVRDTHKDKFRERVGTIVERTLTGEARMDTCKDRIAETERVREEKRARVERGAGDVPVERGNREDEQVAVRHADASGGYIVENQHQEEGMRDIQVSKRGSEAASEEEMDKWRKSVRLEQEAPNASVALEYFASCETQKSAGVRTCAEVRSCG